MLTRALLKTLTIEPEHIEKILDAHGATVEGLKEKWAVEKDELKQKNESLSTELEQTKKDLLGKDGNDESLQAKYEAAQAAYEALKSELEAEKAAHKATVDGYALEKDNATVDGLVKGILETGNESLGKMHPAAIEKALQLYDRAMVKRDKDGNIKNADDILSHFNGEWGDFFAKGQARGIDNGTPPKDTQSQELDYAARLQEARKNNNYKEATQDAVRLKLEAHQAGVVLI